MEDDDIESLIDGMPFIPGHFSLPLNLNGEPAGPAPLRRRDTLAKRDGLRAELRAAEGAQRYAVRNVLGLLAYHLDELERAEDVFRDVCRDDPGNLNAWANLGHVSGRAGRERGEAECLERVAALMDAEDEAEARLRGALCLAEQAFAQLHDVEVENDEDLRERMGTALSLYGRALRHGADLIPNEEKLSWYFKMATVHIRLYGMVSDPKDLEYAGLAHFNKALSLLTESLKSDSPRLRALAWCYTGLLLERTRDFSTVPMAVHDCGLSGSEPLTCYGTGIKLATDDALTLNQLANVFFHSGKYEMATGISNMALDLLPGAELNWQAYSTRAKLKVTGYANALEQAKQGLAGVPDRQDLKEARDDLEKVLSVQPCLRTHLEMAQVFYYMGVDAVQESLMVDEKAVNQALVSLAQALQCPLGPCYPEVQILQGRCLMLRGEDQNAVGCFHRALELERPAGRDRGALHFLLDALLTSYAQSTRDAEELLSRFEESVKLAEARHGAEATNAELRRLCRARTDQVAELSRDLVRKGKLGMVRRLLQCVQPRGKVPVFRSLSV